MAAFLKTRKVTVQSKNGEAFEYEFTPLMAGEAFPLWLELVKALGPALGVLAMEDSLDESAIGKAIAASLKSVDTSVMQALVKALAQKCTVRNGAQNPVVWDVYDLHFAGRMTAHGQWLLEGVVFNFGDFLGDISLTEIKAKVLAMREASKQKSLKDSSGSSGESSPTSE